MAYEYFADCPEPPEFMIMQDDDTVADIGKSDLTVFYPGTILRTGNQTRSSTSKDEIITNNHGLFLGVFIYFFKNILF